MLPLVVYIGWDEHEAIAADVLAYSIKRRASIPVDVRLLKTHEVPIYTRPRHPNQSTAFSFSRFLVPYLCQYEGRALFLDCDMLMLADVADLLREADPDRAVSVCQHDYMPQTTTKFLNQPQTPYPRKNWSSVMLFDNAQCRALTPYRVNTADPAWLHQLQWVHDSQIGSLPLEWNWLVGEYAPNDAAKNLHWTIGGPWFEPYRDADHADLWRDEYASLRGMVRR